MKKLIKTFLKIPRFALKMISDHIFGKEHTLAHRCIVGIIFMIFGVICAKMSVLYIDPIRHIGLDVIGYGLHGIGLSPLIEALVSALSISE